MKTLKRFSAALILLSAFGLTAVGGEIQSPPCSAPGEVNTPPCVAPGETSNPPGEAQAASDSANPGEMQTPPLAEVVAVAADAAFELMLFW
jgi:hypothetical protein